MDRRLTPLYRLTHQLTRHLAAAADADPARGPKVARTLHAVLGAICDNRPRMTAAEFEAARLVRAAVGTLRGRPVRAGEAALLRELVDEALGAPALTDGQWRRAYAAAAALAGEEVPLFRTHAATWDRVTERLNGN